MPRLSRRDQKKDTPNKTRNEAKVNRKRLGQKDDKNKLLDEAITSEELLKINAITGLSDPKQKSQSNPKGTKKIKFPLKSKINAKVWTNTYRPSIESNQSRVSGRSLTHDRASTASNLMEVFKKQLMLLRLDSRPVTRRHFDSEQLKELDFEDDILLEEEGAEPDIGTDTDTETDSDTADRDKIDKLQKSFIKSHQHLQKDDGPKLDFFDIIGDIPDIENISPDISELSEEEETLRQKTSTEVLRDVGKFVDPLTGADESSSSSSQDVHAEPEPEVSTHSIEQEESAGDLLEEIAFDEDQDLGEAMADEDKEKDAGYDDVGFAGWFNAPAEHVIIAENFNQAVSDEHMRKVNIYVLDFLNLLITHAVNTMEIGDPNRIINRTLNKKKLMDELNDKLKQLEVARSESLFLNKAVVKVIRSKGDYRPLQPDNPEQVKRLIARDEELNKRLYDLLYREEELKNVSALKVSNLTAEIEAAEINAKQSFQNLEKNIKKAFCREHSPYMNEVVSLSLKQMSNTCDEIANERFLLMQKLHALGELQEREEALENLGSGLKLRNFEILQAEVTTLGTKIYEKEHELNYLHVKRNKDLHMMTHLMECHSMVESATNIKENFLEDLLEEKSRAREELNYRKMVRTGIRHESYVLQERSGLAGNHALLLDYDKTKTDLEEIRVRVNKMRQKHKQLEGHCIRLEERCNRVSSI